MLNTKTKYQLTFILFCFALSSCLTSRNININDYVKYSKAVYKHINDLSYEAIYSAKYVPYSDNIIIYGEREVYIYNIKEQTKEDIYASLEANISDNIDSIVISECHVVDKNNLVILASIRLKSKEHFLKQILFDILFPASFSCRKLTIPEK